jgi:hypothetical protein
MRLAAPLQILRDEGCGVMEKTEDTEVDERMNP